MRRILFALFFISGFSSLVYQVIWTRLAFASFGIILPVLSVVISVFMLGLSVGAWGAGKLIPFLQRKTGLSAALFYAATELMIGVGAFAVPKLFAFGERLLLTAGQSDSARYLSLSAIVLTLAILPWCLCMGATMPLMMAYVREREPANAESFSFLYLANVIGAMCGTLMTALVLVELFGFHHTLAIAAAGNAVVVAVSAYLGLKRRGGSPEPSTCNLQPSTFTAEPGILPRSPSPAGARMVKWLLFATGFCAMAMEVVWARAFTPVLRTQVYLICRPSFAISRPPLWAPGFTVAICSGAKSFQCPACSPSWPSPPCSRCWWMIFDCCPKNGADRWIL